MAAAVAGMAIGLVAGTTGAHAARVLKVDADGQAHVRHDRLLPPARATALPRTGGARVATAAGLTVQAAATSPLTTAERTEYDAALNSARTVRDGMPLGAARDELSGVIANAAALDASGQLTSSRLAATLMTVRRNKQFWPVNTVPAPGTRVVFTGSPVYLEYYRREGLQIQPLANFGKANAAWSACKADGNTTCSKLRGLLDAMLGLASQRGSFTTWEYFFDFEGGAPPWTSGMSQATGLQALSRAYRLTGDARYRDAAARAVPAFETAPPVGVAVPATGGTHFLMYSFAPQLFIFNGMLQALIGLDDYRDLTGDPRGTTLFRAGHGNAIAILPLADTGSWSRYSVGGPLSTPEYHALLTDMAASLCKRQGNPVYCDTAARFTAYGAAPPA